MRMWKLKVVAVVLLSAGCLMADPILAPGQQSADIASFLNGQPTNDGAPPVASHDGVGKVEPLRFVVDEPLAKTAKTAAEADGTKSACDLIRPGSEDSLASEGRRHHNK